jgi:hypothetical protein
MEASFKQRFLSKEHWLRILFMIAFGVVGWIVQYIIWAIAVIQVILTFAMGAPNQNLLRLGGGLSAFLYHILRFLTYTTEEKPYPFTPWPGSSKESEG